MATSRAGEGATRDSRNDAKEGRMNAEDDRFASALRVNRAVAGLLDDEVVLTHAALKGLSDIALDAQLQYVEGGVMIDERFWRSVKGLVSQVEWYQFREECAATPLMADVQRERDDLRSLLHRIATARRGDYDGQEFETCSTTCPWRSRACGRRSPTPSTVGATPHEGGQWMERAEPLGYRARTERGDARCLSR
jgi:hypothetical protein